MIKRIRRLKTGFFLFLLMIAVSHGEEYAMEGDGVLDGVTIKAMRGDLLPFEAPYTLHVLDDEDFEKGMVRNLPEALAAKPGVLVQKTANGQGSPFLRGFTGYRTLALIDGVRFNNSVYRDGPNEYFSLIDVQALSGLELIQGPSSVLYGSDAIGGTLNLHTKKSSYLDEEGWFLHGVQALRFDSAERSQISRTELDFGEGGKWGLKLGYSWKNFGDVKSADIGTQRKTGYDEYGVDLRFDAVLSDYWTLTLAHQHLEQDDVWRTHSTIFGESFAGSTVGTDLRRLKDQRRSLTYAKLSGVHLEGIVNRVTMTLSYQTTDEDGDRIRSSGARELEYFDSRMAGIDLQLESDTDIGKFVYGMDFYRDRVDSGRVDLNSDGTLDEVRIQGPVGDDSVFDLLGVYVQWESQPADRWAFTSGVRFTHTEASVGRLEDPVTGDAISYDDQWQTVVASIRAAYDLDDAGEWKLWAGISQSFRAPNIADVSRFGASRSTEFEVAATDLEPEKFLTYEIGIKGKTNRLELSGTYYYTSISDYITSTPTGNLRDGLIEVSKQNSSSGYVQGIELAAMYDLGNGWEAFGNITWIEGELDVFTSTSSAVSESESLSRIMPLTFNGGVRWQSESEKWNFALNCTIAGKADRLSTGDESDTQRIPPGGTPGYTLIDLIGSYQVTDDTQIHIGLNNILDEAYRSHGSGSNEPGFGVSFGFKTEF